MRISIREQLGLLVLFCALTSLAVLALAVVRLLFLTQPQHHRAHYSIVVSKLCFHHRYPIIEPLFDRLTQGCSTVQHPTSIPNTSSIGQHASSGPKRAGQVLCW
jgi:hypothetical protein